VRERKREEEKMGDKERDEKNGISINRVRIEKKENGNKKNEKRHEREEWILRITKAYHIPKCVNR
jgi:hypothetical protein